MSSVEISGGGGSKRVKGGSKPVKGGSKPVLGGGQPDGAWEGNITAAAFSGTYIQSWPVVTRSVSVGRRPSSPLVQRRHHSACWRWLLLLCLNTQGQQHTQGPAGQAGAGALEHWPTVLFLENRFEFGNFAEVDTPPLFILGHKEVRLAYNTTPA